MNKNRMSKGTVKIKTPKLNTQPNNANMVELEKANIIKLQKTGTTKKGPIKCLNQSK